MSQVWWCTRLILTLRSWGRRMETWKLFWAKQQGYVSNKREEIRGERRGEGRRGEGRRRVSTWSAKTVFSLHFLFLTCMLCSVIYSHCLLLSPWHSCWLRSYSQIAPFCFHVWYGSCASSNSFWCAWLQWPHHTQKTTFYSTLPVLQVVSFSTPSSTMSPGPHGSDTNVPFRAEHSAVPYSQHYFGFRSCASAIAHCQMRLLWARLRDVPVYGYTHEYLESSLTTCPFNKVSIADSLISSVTCLDIDFWPGF